METLLLIDELRLDYASGVFNKNKSIIDTLVRLEKKFRNKLSQVHQKCPRTEQKCVRSD